MEAKRIISRQFLKQVQGLQDFHNRLKQAENVESVRIVFFRIFRHFRSFFDLFRGLGSSRARKRKIQTEIFLLPSAIPENGRKSAGKSAGNIFKNAGKSSGHFSWPWPLAMAMAIAIGQGHCLGHGHSQFCGSHVLENRENVEVHVILEVLWIPRSASPR